MAPVVGDMSTTASQDVSDLPPSAKLVYKTLAWNGELTQGEIAEESLLAHRTVRNALDRLDEVGAVESRVSFRDARKRIYWLEDSDETL